MSETEMKKMRPVLKRFSLVWVLFVPLWMMWGAATYGGFYRWLCDWQLSDSGEYNGFVTFIIPTLLLIAPAVLFLSTQRDAKPAVPPRPLEPAAAERLVKRVLGFIALGGAIVFTGMWLWAQQYPDMTGTLVDVDLANLGDATPPLGRVTLIGILDTTHVVKKTLDAKGVGGRDLYAPMVLPGSANKLTRIFVQKYVDSAAAVPLPTGQSSRLKGVLVKGGLPNDTRRQFARLGVGIADPYYLLLTGPDGAREDYYVIAYLGGFVALLGLLPLVALFLTKTYRRWKPS